MYNQVNKTRWSSIILMLGQCLKFIPTSKQCRITDPWVIHVPKNCHIDQTWLGVRCHPEGEFRSLLFSNIAGPLRGQNQPVDHSCRCFTEKLPKMYITYVRFWSDFEKSSVLHIFAHWVVKFLAISIYLISIDSYWHRLLHRYKICHWQMHKRGLSWYFNP